MMRTLPRLPLPKEIILPVLQRLLFILLVMCGAALSLRIYSLYKLGKLGHAGTEDARLEANGTYTFLDIGSGNNGFSGTSRTRRLEEHGWRGICMDPFPEADRKCKALAKPVAALSGQLLMLPDCSSTPVTPVLLSDTIMKCPKKSLPSIGIVDALKVSQVPPIIDYVNLATTHALELDILKHFPFQDFCARSWTVAYNKKTSGGIQQLLKDQGCSVKDTNNGVYWARCSCSQFHESLLEKQVESLEYLLEAPFAHVEAKSQGLLHKKTSAEHEKKQPKKKTRGGKSVLESGIKGDPRHILRREAAQSRSTGK